MRAAVLHEHAVVAARPLQLEVVPSPRPSPRQVLVRVDVCAVCRTDLHVIEGELPDRGLPRIPGHQVVGEIVEMGAEVESMGLGAGIRLGASVGIAWLHRTCGGCGFCRDRRENLCEHPEFTGWTVDGGFAELAVAPADFVYPLPENLEPRQAAPLLCAGIIGYRCLRMTGLDERGWHGRRLGLYGFGAAAHLAIQLATSRGAEVYVATRDRKRHQSLARELGACWVGGAANLPPDPLDASIIFAPAGELVPPALRALAPGGVLVLGGIHMSPIPRFPYELLYGERTLRSVANNTRRDGLEFLAEAARLGVEPHVTSYALEDAGQALIDLKHDAIRGAGVIQVDRV